MNFFLFLLSNNLALLLVYVRLYYRINNSTISYNNAIAATTTITSIIITKPKQKKEKINPSTDLIANLFSPSTRVVEDFHRRARGVGEGGKDSIIISQEPSLPPYMRTTISDDNN